MLQENAWHITQRAWQQFDILVRRQELLLSTVTRRKLSWFGHVCRHDRYAAEEDTTRNSGWMNIDVCFRDRGHPRFHAPTWFPDLRFGV